VKHSSIYLTQEEKKRDAEVLRIIKALHPRAISARALHLLFDTEATPAMVNQSVWRHIGQQEVDFDDDMHFVYRKK
jgi:hypothetical protein